MGKCAGSGGTHGRWQMNLEHGLDSELGSLLLVVTGFAVANWAEAPFAPANRLGHDSQARTLPRWRVRSSCRMSINLKLQPQSFFPRETAPLLSADFVNGRVSYRGPHRSRQTSHSQFRGTRATNTYSTFFSTEILVVGRNALALRGHCVVQGRTQSIFPAFQPFQSGRVFHYSLE